MLVGVVGIACRRRPIARSPSRFDVERRDAPVLQVAEQAIRVWMFCRSASGRRVDLIAPRTAASTRSLEVAVGEVVHEVVGGVERRQRAVDDQITVADDDRARITASTLIEHDEPRPATSRARSQRRGRGAAGPTPPRWGRRWRRCRRWRGGGAARPAPARRSSRSRAAGAARPTRVVGARSSGCQRPAGSARGLLEEPVALDDDPGDAARRRRARGRRSPTPGT